VILRLLPILGITFIDILGFSILIPLLPFFVKKFGAPDVAVGIVFAAYSICQLVAGPVWGNLSDRIGRKMVLIVSQVGATIAWTMIASNSSTRLRVIVTLRMNVSPYRTSRRIIRMITISRTTPPP